MKRLITSTLALIMFCFWTNASIMQLLPKPQISAFSGKYLKADLPIREMFVENFGLAKH